MLNSPKDLYSLASKFMKRERQGLSEGQGNGILSRSGDPTIAIMATLQGINLCPFPHQPPFYQMEAYDFFHLVHSKTICE